MQEINRRESEHKTFIEVIQREKTNSKTHIMQLQGRINELEDRLNATENEKRNLFVKLKKSDIEVESLKALNKRHEQETNEKLKGQLTYSDIEAQLNDTRYRMIEKDQALRGTATKLEETQEMLRETTTKLDEYKALLFVREKYIVNLEVLNKRKEEEVNENLSFIGKLEDQITHYEIELQKAEEQLRDANVKLLEKDEILQKITAMLAEIQKKNFFETDTKNEAFEVKSIVPQLPRTDAGTFNSEGMLDFSIISWRVLFSDQNPSDHSLYM